ncbi:MAG: hypothetical protein ACOCX5_03745 [Chloroflexota bacterium]
MNRLHPFRFGLLTLLVSMLLVACGETSGTAQQTLVAHDASMGTLRAAVAATSTANVERLLSTLDYSELQLTRVNEISGRMQSTLRARDIDINLSITQTPTPGPTSAIVVATSTAPPPPGNFTPSPTREITATPTDVPVTPVFSTPTPTSQIIISNDKLRDVVLATGVGSDDCATDAVDSFTSEADQIYIVARAFDIAPGTTVTSVWERTSTGEALATFAFTPDFEIDDECIWFFATPEDFAFTPGNYRVTLQVEGVPADIPVGFSIVTPVTPIAPTEASPSPGT